MASTYISRTLASNGQKKGTISVWFKTAVTGTQRAIVSSYYDANYHAEILLSSNDQIDVFDYRSGYVSRLLTNRLFRDVGAWYHLVYEFDSTNAVADDRNKLWINGLQETSFSSRTNYGSSVSTSWDTDYPLRIGARNSDQYWNGEMSHFYFIQGYNYAASTFGSTDATSGIWTIKTSASVDYDGTGGNSCFLKMEDRTNLDLDSGDNSLTMTTTGTLTATYDNASNNFPTINALSYHVQSSLGSLANGDTTLTNVSSGHWGCYTPTIGASAGKWYIEGKVAAGADISLGVVAMDDHGINTSTSWYIGQHTTDTGYQNSGDYFVGASGTGGWSTYTSGDIIGMALDLDNRKVYFHKNGVYENSGNPVAGTNGLTVTADKVMGFAFGAYNAGSWNINYGNGYFGTTAVSTGNEDDAGEGDFEYDVPAGYYTMCTKNIKAYGG